MIIDFRSEKILSTLFKILQPLFPKNTTILMDNLYEPNTETIDTYSLFLYMQENNIKSYYVLYKKNPLYLELKNANKLKNIIVVDGSFEIVYKSFIPLLFAKSVVTGFCNVISTSWQGRFLKQNKYIKYIYLNHGATFLKDWVLDYYSPKNFNRLIVSNDFEKEIYLKEAKWRESKLIKSCFPRWDMLKKEQHEEKNIFIFFTWRTSFNENNYKQSLYYKKLKSFVNNKRLVDLLSKHKINLTFAYHHAFHDCNIRFEEISDNVNIINITNISKNIGKSDLFITDYSSICFDFMFLNIPTIFYKLDWQDSSLNEMDTNSMKYAMTKDKFLYNCFYDEEEVISKIEYYIKNNFCLEEQNKEINNKFFYFKKDIRKNLSDALMKL